MAHAGTYRKEQDVNEPVEHIHSIYIGVAEMEAARAGVRLDSSEGRELSLQGSCYQGSTVGTTTHSKKDTSSGVIMAVNMSRDNMLHRKRGSYGARHQLAAEVSLASARTTGPSVSWSGSAGPECS